MIRSLRVAVPLALGLASLFTAPARAEEADLPALRAAVKASPKEAAPSLALCKFLRRGGHYAEAVLECQRGASLGAALKDGQNLKLAREAALAKLDLHDVPAALLICDALGKTSALANACRAEAFLSQNRASEALPLAKKAVYAEPTLYEARVAGGRAFGLQGKVAEAEQVLQQATEAEPTRAEAPHYLGIFLLAQGRRDEGVAALKKALAVDPGDPELLLLLGEALHDSKEGQDALLRAVKIRPAFADAQAVLARSSVEVGDVATAETAAIEAMRLDPKSTDAHVVLSRVRLKQSRWDDAIKEAEAAKKLVPNAAGAELTIADAEVGKGDVDLAAEAYVRAFGADRSDPAPLLRAGEACLRANRPTTARGFADKLTGEFPTWAPGWALLGDVLAKGPKGDKDKAIAAYEAALKGEGAIDRDALTKRLDALRARKP